MIAGRCRGRVHQPSTLGIGGRRVLVSRDWSGKTLADHKADQLAWVRQVLALGMGHQLRDPNNTSGQDGGPGVVRVRWERANPQDRDVKPLHQRLWRALGQRIRWRAEWHAARDRLATDTGPPPLLPDVSANHGEGRDE